MQKNIFAILPHFGQTAKGKREIDCRTLEELVKIGRKFQVAFRRLFKSEAVRNCYTGLSIVHRSGIFGTSDILGDVAGGSDWITAHLECKRL